MIVGLPKEMKGKEYEEPIVAYIRSLGYYTETRMILDHNGKQLLELDVVATPSSSNYREAILVDAKSGKDTGFSVLFKIYGWKHFLGIPKGCIVKREKPDERDLLALENFSAQLKMSWEVFDLSNGNFTCDLENTIPKVSATEDSSQMHHFITAWWGSIAERISENGFRAFCKSSPDPELIEKVKEYERASMLSFFEKNPLKRIMALQKAFQSNPYVSGACMSYVETTKNRTHRQMEDSIFSTSEYHWIQYVVLLEHRARISMLKCAVDACLIPEDDNKWSSLHRAHLVGSTTLNFQKAIRKIEDFGPKEKIPYVMQCFIEVFGGFYIDNCTADRELIEKTLGISLDQLLTCIEIYETLFPNSGGWIVRSKEIVQLKFIPSFLRGVGCFMRQKAICEKYEELTSGMAWLMWKWHNSLIDILAKDERLIKEK